LTTAPATSRSLVLRVAGGLARGVARTVGFVVFVVVLTVSSLFANIGTPVVRRVVIAQVNKQVFDRLFLGSLTILSLDHVDPFGISGARVRISDPAGKPILIADGVQSRFATWTLLRTLLFSRQGLVIDIPSVSIRNVDIRLDMDESGMALANVFRPKVASPHSPVGSSPGLDVYVFAPRIRIEHTWAHGTMTGLPYLDGDVTGVDAAFSFGPSKLTVDAHKGQVLARGIALGADAEGAFHGHFEMTPDKPVVMGGRFAWEGMAGTLKETVSAAIEKGRFDAKVDVDEASPEAIRSLWRASPIVVAGTAHVEAHGPLDAIDLAVHAGLGPATADIQGTLHWGANLGAKLHLDVAAIDLHQFAPQVPASALGLKGDVAATLDADRKLAGEANLDFAAGHIGKYLVPHTTLKTNGFRVPLGAFGGDATVVIDEPGAPTTVSAHAAPRGQSAMVDFAVHSHAVRIGALTRVSTDVTGNARIVGKGSIDLESLTMEIGLDTRGDGLARGGLTVGGVTVSGRARGSLLNPDLDLRVNARGVGWEQTTLSKLDVTVLGRALSPHLTLHAESAQLPETDAAVDLEFHDGVVLHHPDVQLQHRGESVRIRAERVHVVRNDVAVDAMRVEGLGEPLSATFELVGDGLRLKAFAPKVDVSRIARLLDLDEILRGGTLGLDADVSVGAHKASGRAVVTLESASIATLDQLSVRLDSHLEDRRLVGTLKARAGDVGTLSVDVKELVIGGTAPLTRASWEKAWGDVSLSSHIDVARAARHIPAGWLPFSVASGVVDVRARLERDDSNDFTPLVNIDVTTADLQVGGLAAESAKPVAASAASMPNAPSLPNAHAPSDPSAPRTTSAPVVPAMASVARARTWTLKGVDTTTSIRVNGKTGIADVTAHFRDSKGELALLEGTSGGIPYEAIYAAPGRALELLPGVPFEAHLTLPPRAVSTWPSFLGRPPVDGDLQAKLDVLGPLAAPHVALTATLTPMTQALARLTSEVELRLRAAYDGARADVDLRAVQATREVLSGQLHALVAAKDLVARGPELSWKASAKVHVESFPLVTIGPLDDRQIRGRVTGDVVIDDLHADAKARASLSVAGLMIGDASYSQAKATFIADGKNVSADVRLDADDGFGAAKATMAVTWGAALFPVPDAKEALNVSLQAKHLRAAFILPFLRGSIDELDGLIDADAKATVDPVSRSVHVQGTASLADGLFEVASFGGELHAITGKLRVTPDGVMTLDGLTAQGVSGELMASASARLDGLRLVSASAVVLIPKSRALPLSVDGSLVGAVDGRLNVTESLSTDRKTATVKVDIPSLHLLVPEASSQNVQALGVIPGVTLGRRATKTGDFVPDVTDDENDDAAAARPANATRVQISTHFGDDVSIKRGTDVRVDLTGGPTVTIADTTSVTGQVQLRGGVLNLYGKVFDIEHGTVSFVGADPSNPQVSVTAGWIAPDGTQIKADFVGPLRTGKVTLRSEPPLGKNDILQLLLFGTTEGQAAGAPPPGTSSAEGLAGNVATQPLNRALNQFGLSSVSAKVDSNSSNAKPEVEVQIAKDISLQVAEVVYIGPPPPGSSPDRTLLTIDWRFLRKWSLQATVGDAGSTIVDLIWQYRY